jgi:hypothetical protein
MKRIVFALPGLCLLVALTGCSLSLLGTPSPLATLISIPSPTPQLVSSTAAAPTSIIPTPTVNLPTVTPVNPGTPTATTGDVQVPTIDTTPTQTISGFLSGGLSGPYGVILIAPGDVLNVRSGPGEGYPASGSFASAATNVIRTGLSSTVGNDLWVQVQNPAGGNGWVNSAFLSEYVSSPTFCADSRVNTLLTNLGNAIKTSNGEALASLVSPAHGMTVYLWRHGIAHTFKPGDARWMFSSTFEHNWGSAPASGLDTIGAFHVVVLPDLLEVFNASYSLTCNSLGTAAQYGSDPWPQEYTNVNFYTVYKPGTPGVDLDFRYWLVGVEYIQGQPRIFALIHFAWEP